MKKLRLEVEALEVEQFGVEAAGRGAVGTVVANSRVTQIGSTAPCFTCPAEPTVPQCP